MPTHEQHQHPQFICSRMNAGYYNFGRRLSRNANEYAFTVHLNGRYVSGGYAAIALCSLTAFS